MYTPAVARALFKEARIRPRDPDAAEKEVAHSKKGAKHGPQEASVYNSSSSSSSVDEVIKPATPPTSASKEDVDVLPVSARSKPMTMARRLKVGTVRLSGTAAKPKTLTKRPERFQKRPSRNPISEESLKRRAFSTRGLAAIKSYWRPPIKPSMEPTPDGVAFKSQKRQERDERVAMGLPRNVQPVTITTRYRQYKLPKDKLVDACKTDRDRQFMDIVTRNGRLLPIDRWKCYTLVQGEAYQHDLGIFVALDLALVTLILNFYHDMRRLMQGRRQKIRVADVRYLIDHIWANQVMNAYKILVPQFKTSKAVRIRHRKEEDTDKMDTEDQT